MTLSDAEIIGNIRRGARHQFAHLVNRHKDKAMTVALRMLKRREDAEEATQDAFVRAYHGLEKFEGNAMFGTWFYRILYNVCLTRLGNRKKEYLSVDYDDEVAYDDSVSLINESENQRYEEHDLLAYVTNVIDQLPSKYSTILTLFYLQEFTHEEICAVTRLPLGTVKIHLHRARLLLQKQMRNEFKMERATL